MLKIYILSVLACFFFTMANSQVPDQTYYQFVVHDGENNVLKNQPVKIRISLLQGSNTGKVVLMWSANDSTNANGLITTSMPLDSVDWNNGPYFLKIESSVAEDSTYKLVSNHEILSLPYAFKVITADTVLDTLKEEDPVFSSWNKDYNSLINKPSIADSVGKQLDGSETKIMPGTNVQLTGSGTQSDPYVISTDKNNCGTSAHYVGELYGGGVVFWVDRSGEHGLICGMVNLCYGCGWIKDTTEVGQDASSLWNGLGNSEAIVAKYGSIWSAAKLCLDYTNEDYGTGIYSDWYLPSIVELKLLWNSIFEVQKALDTDNNPDTDPISETAYWSSTEDGNEAWNFYFDDGTIFSFDKYFFHDVRAIRAF